VFSELEKLRKELYEKIGAEEIDSNGNVPKDTSNPTQPPPKR